MSHLTLADCIDDLERGRQLARIAGEVSPDLELAAIARRAADEKGPALLFAHLPGSDWPLVTNLFASPERVVRVLDLKHMEELRSRSEQLLQPSPAAGWLDSLRFSAPQARWSPRVIKNGACQQVVRLASDVDLGQLLRVRWWPEEESPSLPAVVAMTQAPDDAWRGLELCSATLLDRQRLLLSWEPHGRLALLWRQQMQRRERLPLALSLGGHPAEVLSAATPLGTEVDRWVLCGWLRERACDLVRARTLPLEVPADAEIIVEGFLDPATPTVASPRRAELSGFYSLPGEGVVMHVTAVTQRTNPVQVAIAPTKPPHEIGVVRQTMLEALQPLVLAMVSGLVDFHFPAAAGYRHVAFVSFEKTRPHQARQLAGALWALEPWFSARLLVLVDADADVRNEAEILYRIASHADMARDSFQQCLPGEAAHHASPVAGIATSLAIDATRKLPAEHGRPWPRELSADSQLDEQVTVRWRQLGLTTDEARC